MTTKYTQLFQASTVDSDGNPARNAGWSESHYTDLPPTGTAITAATTALDQKRAALMPANTKIVGSRVQEVDTELNVGQSRSYESNIPGNAGTQNDLPSMSLEWRVRSTEGANAAELHIRGVPDARVLKGEFDKGSSSFNQALISFFNELKNGWKFRGRVRTNIVSKIANITVEGTVATQTPHGLAEGDLVRLLRTRNVSGKLVSGVYFVASTSNALTFVLANWTGNGQVLKGKVRKAGYAFFNLTILDSEVLDPLAVNRKVGRPFHLFRGRRTAKK